MIRCFKSISIERIEPDCTCATEHFHSVSYLHHHLLSIASMARQFFVGGNFKMNPATRQQKVAITEVLNKADLDQNTGMHLERI